MHKGFVVVIKNNVLFGQELATKVSIDLKNGRVTTGRTAQLLTNECNKLLSDCIALPAYIKYEHEDRNLSKKITSLYWVTPEHLNLNVDLLVSV